MPKHSPLTNDLQVTEALKQYSLVRKKTVIVKSRVKQKLYCPFRRLKHFCFLQLWYNKIRKWKHSDWTISRRSTQLSSALITKALSAADIHTASSLGIRRLPRSRSALGSSELAHTSPWPWPLTAEQAVLHHNPTPASSSSAALGTERGLKKTRPTAFVGGTPTNGFLLWQ